MYYSIQNLTDKTVGNVFPQAKSINQNIAHAIKFNSFLNLDAELLFQIDTKANLTDILSQAAINTYGLLINEKVKNILSSLKLMEHRYYKTLVRDNKGMPQTYYWLHIYDFSILEKIDYEKSKFYLCDSGFWERDIDLLSYDDYVEKKKSLSITYTFHAERIEFKEGYKESFDLFVIPIFTNQIIITEKLKEIFLKEKITGILIEKSILLNTI
jgi:hypothetical protein